MKNRSFIFLFVLFFYILSFSSIYPNGQSKSGLDNNQLASIYLNTLNKLKLPGIEADKINTSKLEFIYRKDDDNPNITIADIRCDRTNKALDMVIDSRSGKIMHCDNVFALYELDKSMHEGADKPTKKKEEVLEEANKYVIAINGKLPEQAFFKECEFIVSGWYDSKHSYDGAWVVRWGRKEGTYRYKEDYIALGIYEKYGLEGYTYDFFSDYHPPKKLNIPQSQAIETAQKNINKIIHSSYFAGTFNGYKVGKIDSSELMIVNPNYAHKKMFNNRIHPDPYARLAWVVRFGCIPKTKDFPAGGLCEIWIDAETGEVLGGD